MKKGPAPGDVPGAGPDRPAGGDARIRTGGEGFAGPCLTAWPRRLAWKRPALRGNRPLGVRWSGQRGSNPRPQPWQGCALPTEPCPPARRYYTARAPQAQGEISEKFRGAAPMWAPRRPRTPATARQPTGRAAPRRPPVTPALARRPQRRRRGRPASPPRQPPRWRRDLGSRPPYNQSKGLHDHARPRGRGAVHSARAGATAALAHRP